MIFLYFGFLGMAIFPEGMTKGLYNSISCSTRHGLCALICFNFDGYGAEIGLLAASIYPQRSPSRG